VIAFTTRNEDEIAARLRDIFSEAGVTATVRSTSADNHGAWVSREPVPVTGRRQRKDVDV
jgi:hypothetical protein